MVRPSNNECRGSLVHARSRARTTRCRSACPASRRAPASRSPPGARPSRSPQTITLPAARAPRRSTSRKAAAPSGYVLYQPDRRHRRSTSQNGAATTSTISAPYVIVRGLTLKGAQADAIRLLPGAHDVVIEDNDISGWGRSRANGRLAARHGHGFRRARGVQRRQRSSASSSSATASTTRATARTAGIGGHPAGPQAITSATAAATTCSATTRSTADRRQLLQRRHRRRGQLHRRPASRTPTPTSTATISQGWDDGIEAEGGNRNVRIWGNYIDQTGTGIASTVAARRAAVHLPQRVQPQPQAVLLQRSDADDRGPFFKSGSEHGFGGGRRYVFHNTSLQATQPGAIPRSAPARGIEGIEQRSDDQHRFAQQHLPRLEIELGLDQPGAAAPATTRLRPLQRHHQRLCRRRGERLRSARRSSPAATAASDASGMYQLAPGSAGLWTAVHASRTSTTCTRAPDIGAHQSGTGGDDVRRERPPLNQSCCP